MAKRVPLRNSLGGLGLIAVLGGCQPNKPLSAPIPASYVAYDVAGWQQRGNQLWFNNQPFSGHQFQCLASGDTLFTGTYLHGKAEGLHRRWHMGGKLKEARHYQNGWQEGIQRGWYESGKPSFIYHFKQDVYDGTRTEWYTNGQRALYGHYHEGQEEGPQQQWFADGRLKVNYVVRNGRHYGFTGVKHCINVWDSVRVAL